MRRRFLLLLPAAQQYSGGRSVCEFKSHLLSSCASLHLGRAQSPASSQRSESWWGHRTVSTLGLEVDPTADGNSKQSRREPQSRMFAGLAMAPPGPVHDVTASLTSVSHYPPDAPMPEDMLRLLLQPLPLSRRRTKVLNDRLVVCGDAAFLDPTTTLHSMMRALYVVKQVLRANGQVYVVNGNPLSAPLLRETANCCMNGNVWFRSGQWRPGMLETGSSLFKQSHQPNRELFAARNLKMSNVLASGGTGAAAEHAKLRKLGSPDKWRLWHLGRSRTDPDATPLLRKILKQETSVARLPLPGSPRGHSGALVRLIVAMSPTHDAGALEDAFIHGVPTISLVNLHSPLDRITYPVYASDSHIRFHHFFMDWLLKVVNLPAPRQQA